MSKRALVLMCSIFLIVPLLFMGCSGDDGSTGATGPAGTPGQDLTSTAKPETCAVCHPGGGDNHQKFYDTLYQGGIIKVTGLGVSYTAPNVYTTTFTMTSKDSTGGFAPVNCQSVTNLNAYIVSYTDNIFQMPDATIPADNAADRLTLKPGPPNAQAIQDNVFTYRGKTTTVGDGTTGLCTITGTYTDNVADFTGTPGYLVVYGYDGLAGTLPPSRVRQVNYPYAGLLKLGTVDYLSAANVSGCEKCHTVPYLKHGNILGQVDNAATDLITCKACHLDNGDGGHQVWQLLVDDTVKAGDYWALNPGSVEEEMTLAELAKYAYKTRLMNDVHMSHAMEFEYPQSMANCNTCHAGKLDKIFTDNNFVLETCKSCHAVTGSAQSEKPQPSLADVVPHTLTGRENCYGCHAGAFKTVTGHTGYDKVIYGTDNGVKYSDVIKVTIDNASLDNTNKLTISFSSTGTLGGLVTPNIKPTVLVGLYGYDTKDYIVGPHERNFDDNGDGKIDSDDSRNLEYVVGATHPRFTFDNTTPGGSWKVTANLSPWAGMISAGSVKRVEIGVMPALKNPNNDNALVALDAPSKTFDLKTKKFVKFYPEIVKVATGCNNCHDALATTFHSADRGGNIVVCRLCHITKSGGSHLEMQSRSIDSYAHAIHTFQDFDIGDIDFDNNVESMFHELKIESHYPTFDTTNCTSCHNAGTFNVPDQAKSLAGILSASDEKTDENQTLNRMITGVPTYVSGPASRACGACHRAELIKEDAASELASFNQHTKDGGYLLEPGNIPTLTAAINAIMPMFYDDVMVVLP